MATEKKKAEVETEETKTTEPTGTSASAVTDPGEELVEVYLFKDNGKYKDDVFVAVNGERVQIKRGEHVMVKRKFAQVLAQSQAQDTATANLIDQKSAEYSAQANALGV